jgi:hypothetical protein
MNIGDKLRQGINPRTGLLGKSSNYQGSLIGANGTGADTATDIQDQRALSQSGATALGNSVVRLGANILGEVMGAGANAASMWRDERSYNDTVWDIMKSAGDDLKESAAENFEILSTSDDKGLQWSDAVNPKFWANTVEQFGPTIAMMAVSMGAAGIASKGLLGMMKTVNPTMAKNIAVAEAALAKGLDGTAKGASAVAKLNKYKQISNTVSATAISRSIESGMEATQAYDQIRETLKADGRSEKEARALAAQGASEVYKANWALAVLDLAQFDMIYNNPIAKDALGKVPKGLKGLGSYATQMVSEGAEEGIQYAFSTEAEAKAVGRETDVMEDYFKNDEFWESVVQGALGGVVFQGIGDIAKKIGKTKEKAIAKEKEIKEDSKTLTNNDPNGPNGPGDPNGSISEYDLELLKYQRISNSVLQDSTDSEELKKTIENKNKKIEEVKSNIKEDPKNEITPYIEREANKEFTTLEISQKEMANAESIKEDLDKATLKDNSILADITQEQLNLYFDELRAADAASNQYFEIEEHYSRKIQEAKDKKIESPAEHIKKHPNKKKYQTAAAQYNAALNAATKANTNVASMLEDPSEFYETRRKAKEQKILAELEVNSKFDTKILDELSKTGTLTEEQVAELRKEYEAIIKENPNLKYSQVVSQLEYMTKIDDLDAKIDAAKLKIQENPSISLAVSKKVAKANNATKEELENLENAETPEERKVILDGIKGVEVIRTNSVDYKEYTQEVIKKEEANQKNTYRDEDGNLNWKPDNSLPKGQETAHREWRDEHGHTIKTAWVESQPDNGIIGEGQVGYTHPSNDLMRSQFVMVHYRNGKVGDTSIDENNIPNRIVLGIVSDSRYSESKAYKTNPDKIKSIKIQVIKKGRVQVETTASLGRLNTNINSSNQPTAGYIGITKMTDSTLNIELKNVRYDANNKLIYSNHPDDIVNIPVQGEKAYPNQLFQVIQKGNKFAVMLVKRKKAAEVPDVMADLESKLKDAEANKEGKVYVIDKISFKDKKLITLGFNEGGIAQYTIQYEGEILDGMERKTRAELLEYLGKQPVELTYAEINRRSLASGKPVEAHLLHNTLNQTKPLIGTQFQIGKVIADKATTPTTENQTSEVEVVSRYTNNDVKNNPNKIYVFGDNTQRRGRGGQAQIRNNENAFGIATKLEPNNSATAFMSDNDLQSNKNVIDSDITKIKADGRALVFPKDGFGTGLAKLKEKAPQTYAYLKQRLQEEFSFNNDTGVVSKPTQQTSEVEVLSKRELSDKELQEILTPDSYIRSIGQKGLEDALESGVIRPSGTKTGKPKYKDTFYGVGQKGLARALDYASKTKNGVLVVLKKSDFKEKFGDTPGTMDAKTREQVAITKAKVLMFDDTTQKVYLLELSQPTQQTSEVEIAPTKKKKTNKFKTSVDKGKGNTVSPETIKWFKSRFPNFPIHLLKDLNNIAGTNAWGVFTKAMVAIKEGARDSVVYHEAMHVMTEVVLTPAQRKQVMDLGLIAYNKANPKNKITKEELEAAILGNKESRTKLKSRDNINYANILRKIAKRRSLVTQQDLNNSQLIKDLRVDKTQPNTLDANQADLNLTSIMLYGHKFESLSNIDYLEDNNIDGQASEEMKLNIRTLAYRILNDLLFDINDLTALGDSLTPEFANALTTNENPVKEFYTSDIFDVVDSKLLSTTTTQSQDTSLDAETRILEFLSEQYEEFEINRLAGLSNGNILKRLGAQIYNFFKKVYHMTRGLFTDNINDLDTLNYKLSLGLGTAAAHPSMEKGTRLYDLAKLKDVLDEGKPANVSSSERLRDSINRFIVELDAWSNLTGNSKAKAFESENMQGILEDMVKDDPDLKPIQTAYLDFTEEFLFAAKIKLKKRGVTFEILQKDSNIESEIESATAIGRDSQSYLKVEENPQSSLSEEVLSVLYSIERATEVEDSYGYPKFEDYYDVYNKFLRATHGSTSEVEMLERLLPEDQADEVTALVRVGKAIENNPQLQAKFLRLAQKRKVNPIIIVGNAGEFEAMNANQNDFEKLNVNIIRRFVNLMGIDNFPPILEGQALFDFLNNAGITVTKAQVEKIGKLKLYDIPKTTETKTENSKEFSSKYAYNFVRRMAIHIPDYYQSMYYVNNKKKYAHRYTSHVYMEQNRLIRNKNNYNARYSKDPLLKILTTLGVETLASRLLFEVDSIKTDGKPTDYDKMSREEYLNAALALYFNFEYKKGSRAIPMPVMGDGHTMIAAEIPRGTSFKAQIEEATELLEMLFDQETSRIEDKVTVGSANYNKNKTSRFLIPQGTNAKGELLDLKDPETAKSSVKQDLDLLVQNLKNEMEAFGISKEKYSDIQLRAFVAQTLQSQILNTLMYTGDPANFKSDNDGNISTDFFKRFKQVYSPGEYLAGNAMKIGDKSLAQERVETYDDTPGKAGNPLLNVEVHPDLVALELGIGTKRADGKTYATVQDGQSFIDPFSSIVRLAGAGEIAMPQTKEEFMALYKNFNHVIYKPHYFGLHDTESGLLEPIQKKDSEVVLDPEFAYHNPEMAKILRKFGWIIPDKLNGESIDGIDFNFEGRVAAKQSPLLGEFIDMYAPYSVFKIGLPKGRTNLSLLNWKAQLDTTPHIGPNQEQKLARQLVKLIDVDIPRLNDKKKRYIELLKKKTIKLQKQLKETFSNHKALKKSILEQLDQYPIEIQEAFRDGTIDLKDPQVIKQVEPVLSSLIRNKVSIQKVKGNSMFNVSAYGLSKENMPKVIIEKNKDGSIKKVIFEAWVPEGMHPAMDKLSKKYMGKRIPLSEIPDGFKEMMMYRIPTEDKYSMFVIRPIGILPKRMSNGIIMPVEGPDISGFDYDIDKLFGFQYDVDSNGIKIKNSINNEILDLMIEFKHATPIEGLTPGGYQQLSTYYDTNKVLLDKSSKKINNTGVDSPRFLGVSAQIEALNNILEGMNNVGISANWNTGMPLIEMELKNPLVFTSSKSNSEYDPNRTVTSLSIKKDGKGNNASRNRAEPLAQAVDNGKDPLAAKLNLNNHTLPIYNLLVSAGSTAEEALNMINQPEFKRFVKEAKNSDNIGLLIKDEFGIDLDSVKYKNAPYTINLDSLDLVQSTPENMETALRLYMVAKEISEKLAITKMADTGVGPTYAQTYLDFIKYIKFQDKLAENKFKNIKILSVKDWVTAKIKIGLIDGKEMLDEFLPYDNDFYIKNIELIEEITHKPLNVKTLTSLFSRLQTVGAVRIKEEQDPTYFDNIIPELEAEFDKLKDNSKYSEFVQRITRTKVTRIVNGKAESMMAFSLGNVDSDNASVIMDLWSNMLGNTETEKFARLLADYQMMKSGFEVLPGSFWNVMPLELRKNTEIVEEDLSNEFIAREIALKYPTDYTYRIDGKLDNKRELLIEGGHKAVPLELGESGMLEFKPAELVHISEKVQGVKGRKVVILEFVELVEVENKTQAIYREIQLNEKVAPFTNKGVQFPIHTISDNIVYHDLIEESSYVKPADFDADTKGSTGEIKTLYSKTHAQQEDFTAPDIDCGPTTSIGKN